MTQHQIKTECPFCFLKVELCCNNLGNEKGPKQGHPAVCIECGGIAIFDERLQLVPASEDDLRPLAESQPTEYGNLLMVSKAIKDKKGQKLSSADHNAFPNGRWQ